MNKKKNFYLDNQILLASLIGLALIIYSIGVVVFLNKGDDKTVGAFAAISSITGVILSICTIFYVVKAFEQQKNQNEIQNQQIEIQKQEIENIRKAEEYNRALDLTHKQIEYIKIFLRDDYYLKKLDSEMNNLEIYQFYVDSKLFLDSVLLKVYECLSAINIIIHSTKLDIYSKNYILKLATLTIGQTFLQNLSILKPYTSNGGNEPVTDLYMYIDLIEILCSRITDENIESRISIAKGHLEGFN